MTKINNIILTIITLLVILTLATCKKDIEPPIVTIKITDEQISPTAKTVTVNNTYSYDGTLSFVRLFLSKNREMESEKGATASIQSENNSFTLIVRDLEPLTTYYYQYEFTNLGGFSMRTEVDSFITTDYSLPTVSTTSYVSDITINTAVCGGNVSDDGETPVTARGVCWSTSQSPTTANTHTSNGSGTGSFTSSLTGLTTNTTYYVRAYATNSKGTAYGAQKSFTTLNGIVILTTNNVTNITMTTATTGGNITSDGGLTVTARGVCWSTSQSPTTANTHTSNGSGTGSFTSSLTGLTKGTTYYVRAYATNANGTVYGAQKSFTTLNGIPTLTTTAASNIAATSATSGGNITSDGGLTVTARGVCWSTSSTPTINNSHTTNGSGTGSFTSSLTGLTKGTTYYVRAYATNSQGTYYGAQKSFTTLNGIPTLTTTAASNITATSATSGGNITSDGGLTVTARGVCWSTSSTPTINNSHTTNGSGTGSFTSSLTGLTAGTTYYVRAYATNSQGTYYGTQKSFYTTTATTCGSNITDIDGNSYPTVQLGTQCWMAKNLRTTKYATGTTISLGSSTSTSTAYRYYPNNNSSNVSSYGYLYNWKAVMGNSSSSSANPSGVQGICPTGWHVPSNAEWAQLTTWIGSQSQYQCGGSTSQIAKALASTYGWVTSTNTCAVGNGQSSNNATGFSAPPAGYYNGSYSVLGYSARFWSATEGASNDAYRRYLLYGSAYVYSNNDNKYNGFSVRCLRD